MIGALVVLLLGLGIAGVSAAVGVAAAAVSQLELTRWVAYKLRGSSGAAGLLDNPGHVLATANTLTTLGVLLAAGAVPALLAATTPTFLGIFTITAGVPLFISAAYLVPRVMGRRWAEPLVARAVPWMERGGTVLAPFIPGRDPSTRTTLAALLSSADPAALAAADEMAVVSGVLAFADRPVRELMTPRTAIVAMPEGMLAAEAAHVFQQSGYSRYPVYRGSLDDVIGVAHTLDLLRLQPEDPVPARPALTVPGAMRAADLMLEMQRGGGHLAVVLDEYGGTAGLVTFEDLLKELVGEIFERPAEPPAVPARIVELDGSAPLAVLEEQLGVRLDVRGVQTVGGLLVQMLGRIPRAGGRFLCKGLEFDILAASATRVERVAVRPGPVRPMALDRSDEPPPPPPPEPRLVAKKKELTYLDVAEAWPRLTAADRVRRLKQLPPDAGHEFFFDLSGADQAEVLLMLPPGERRPWIRLLAPDDVADVIQAAPADQRAGLLALLDEPTDAEVTALLAYAEDEAGGLMNPRYIRVRPDMTAGAALGYFRRQAQERSGRDTPTEAYVLDADGKLLGQVALTNLIAADPASSVARLMRTDIVTIPEAADQEEVAHRFAEHGLVAAPVVDAAGRMKGVVTADDVVAVVEEEATEDIQKLGGSEALDAPYLKTAFNRMVRKRAGWLAALFLGEMLTATAMAFFEQEIARAVVLALFVPLIISSGGNSGSQASTLVIRAMALGEVRLRDWWRVVRREIAAGVVLGTVLGAIGFLRIVVWHAITAIYGEHYLLVALTVCGSLIGVVTFGTVAGSTLPFVLRRAGFDPASASAPFVATLVDVTGLVIYFTMASLILRGTLL